MRRHLLRESFINLHFRRAHERWPGEDSWCHNPHGRQLGSPCGLLCTKAGTSSDAQPTEPSLSERRIIELARVHSRAEVADRLGVSRQYVQQVLAKWSGLFPISPPTYRPMLAVPQNQTNPEVK